MNKKIEFSIRNIIIIGIIFCVLAGGSAYISTSYAITENGYAAYGSNIEYKDNSGLGVTNVQAALDSSLVKISNQISELKKSMYPVGSIYITTDLSLPDKVSEKIGGTWVRYGEGKVLKSTNGVSGDTGGKNTVTLTPANLPSHTHDYKPSGNVSASFKGTAVTSGNNSVTPKATFTGSSATTNSSGEHNHNPYQDTGAKDYPPIYPQFHKNMGLSYGEYTVGPAVDGKVNYLVAGYKIPKNALINAPLSGPSFIHFRTVTAKAGAHTHTLTAKGTVDLSNTTHTHSVTAKGDIETKFTGERTKTESTGSGSAISVEDEYITVYMYRRTA